MDVNLDSIVQRPAGKAVFCVAMSRGVLQLACCTVSHRASFIGNCSIERGPCSKRLAPKRAAAESGHVS